MIDSASERKKCAECGEPIVGVIPKWKDGQPLCRNCAYKFIPTTSPQGEEATAEGARLPGEGMSDQRRRVLSILAGVLVLGAVAALALLPLRVSSEKPLHRGGARLDRLGDACVQNLWTLSRAMQDDRLSEVSLACPASGRPYVVVRAVGDTVIRCPDPKAHQVTAIQVSRKTPFPAVIP